MALGDPRGLEADTLCRDLVAALLLLLLLGVLALRASVHHAWVPLFLSAAADDLCPDLEGPGTYPVADILDWVVGGLFHNAYLGAAVRSPGRSPGHIHRRTDRGHHIHNRPGAGRIVSGVAEGMRLQVRPQVRREESLRPVPRKAGLRICYRMP